MTFEAALALAAAIVVALSVVMWVMYQKLSKVLSVTRAQLTREANNVISQMEALTALHTTLKLDHALPPTRGWAASPDFLRNVMAHALTARPHQIVECSSGISTVVLARCMQLNGSGHVFSLEHDRTFAEKTRALLRQQGLQDHATVLDAPLVPTPVADWQGPWYSTSHLPEGMSIDMLVVDGPPMDTTKAARYPAVPVLQARFHAGTTVYLDDADRPDEQWSVEKWLQVCPELRRIYTPPCEKGCVALETATAPAS